MRVSRDRRRSAFARHGAQAPDDLQEKGSSSGVEPQPLGRDDPDGAAAARGRASTAGYVAAGLPIEAVASNETFAVPRTSSVRDTYVLRVRGDSMIDEQIRDGDFVVVEDRKTADNGDGHRAAAGIGRDLEEVLPRPAVIDCNPPTPRCSRFSPTPIRSDSRRRRRRASARRRTPMI